MAEPNQAVLSNAEIADRLAGTLCGGRKLSALSRLSVGLNATNRTISSATRQAVRPETKQSGGHYNRAAVSHSEALSRLTVGRRNDNDEMGTSESS